VVAQAAPADSTTTTSDGKAPVTTMSQFEVTTTQGHGYAAPTSAAAFKTNEALINIPQSVQVVTKDFIDDLNNQNTTEILRYFGVNAKFIGDTMLMRGSNIQVQPWIDDIPVKGFYTDSAMFDSYEIIKGPAQALYLGAGIGGFVLETTKKPLPFNQDIITASLDQWGMFRATVDATGPIGTYGDTSLGYRVVGAYQNGNEYWKDGKRERKMVMPQFSLTYKGLSVRIYYSYVDTIAQQGTAFITPTGDINTIGGYKNAANHTEGYAPEWQTSNVFLEALQKISDNWETKVSGSYYRQHVYGDYFSATNVNYDNNTGTWIDRIANEKWNYWTALWDAQGHYEVGPASWLMPSRDNFGFNFSNWTDKQGYWQTTPFPYPNGPIAGKVVIPFGQTDGTVLAPASAFTPPASGSGLLSNVTQDAIYWQHEMDVIPNRLTLLACFTWANILTEQIANWAIKPYVSTHTPGTQWVHRLGGVIHITPEISAYVLNSTNFSTPLGALLQNGALAPNQVGTGNEAGLKWNFFGGKLSGEAAAFKVETTNSLNTIAGLLPNGLNYAAVIGNTDLRGVDGDLTWEPLPGWQLVAQGYKGRMRDALGNPVSLSWENSFGMFTRYAFQDGALKGWAIGGGANKIGSRWVASGGVITYAGGVPTYIKVKDGLDTSAFVQWAVNRHWTLAVQCKNLLDKKYVEAFQSPVFADASLPTTFTFETTFKY
jgi:iron complex outermembrane receptor protein